MVSPAYAVVPRRTPAGDDDRLGRVVGLGRRVGGGGLAHHALRLSGGESRR
jgi:hypothetical protein